MNNLSKYIVEKLRINKNIELRELYKPNDRCLFISYYYTKALKMITLDILEITKRVKNNLHYTCKTSFAHKKNDDNFMIVTNDNKSRYLYSLFTSDYFTMISIIIPNYESLEVIEKIKKDGNKIKFFDILGYVPDGCDELPLELKACRIDNSQREIQYSEEDMEELKNNL